jgi:hypothetical protein
MYILFINISSSWSKKGISTLTALKSRYWENVNVKEAKEEKNVFKYVQQPKNSF